MAMPDAKELLAKWESDGTVGFRFLLLPALRKFQADTLRAASAEFVQKHGPSNRAAADLRAEAARLEKGEQA